ncbi:MAG TPA: hypothetical protein VMI75_37380 [Polyangiaceae bacterium]|nr:hypothetical protein [Polyangiaceae bacterium]
MKRRTTLLVLALALVAGVALADYGSPPPPPPAQHGSGNDSNPNADGSVTPRMQATPWYGDTYDDVVHAQQSLANGDRKGAEKRFKRALQRGQRTVEIDSTYHEAWNLIGFSARMLGDYPTSLAAYRTCLRLKPDYAPAREYFGEALLETGDRAGAREQLAWLKRLSADSLATSLQSAIDRWQAAHPDTAAAPH